MPQIQLTVTHDTDNGSTTVNGPLDQPLLAYGMLEVARDAISDRKRQAQESLIQAPPQGFVLPGV